MANGSPRDEKKAEITALLKSKHTLIWLVSGEERRAESLIVDAAATARFETRFWDCADGITGAAGETILANAGDPSPGPALAFIRDQKAARAVYVLRDFHAWTDPVTVRSLKNLAKTLESEGPTEANPNVQSRAIVVLSPKSEVPEDLRDVTAVVDLPIPTRDEIATLLGGTIESLPEEFRKDAAPNGTRDRAIDAACGLTAKRAESAYALSLVQNRGKIDAASVAAEKKRVISGIPGITWIDPDPRGLGAVAGLDVLKSWLEERKLASTPAARAYGLPAPKGCVLVGVPGCGKSLTAKAVATAFGVALIRVDLGAMKDKFQGESEGKIRNALGLIGALSRCVVWIDEIEKVLAGSTGPQGDSGTSADQLGTLLSWLQDRTVPGTKNATPSEAFVVVTANDVTALPPELLRKGRFDEVFFVDLPNRTERRAILDVTLRTLGRDPSTIDTASVAAKCEGFSGAEVADLVGASLFRPFADGARPLTAEDMLYTAAKVVPLSKQRGESIERLRAWGKTNARAASTPEVTTVTTGRKLDTSDFS
jgi:ATPase family associated with various cellular activities (AAA)